MRDPGKKSETMNTPSPVTSVSRESTVSNFLYGIEEEDIRPQDPENFDGRVHVLVEQNSGAAQFAVTPEEARRLAASLLEVAAQMEETIIFQINK